MIDCCAPAQPVMDTAAKARMTRELVVLMVAMALAVLAGVWQFGVAGGTSLSQWLLAAAALVLAPSTLKAGWHSLSDSGLHGLTGLLVAMAYLGALLGGDLASAALLPILMSLGHLLEERSLLGSREAIYALGRLTRSQARRLGADGVIESVENGALRPGDLVEARSGDHVPADGVVVEGESSLDTSPVTGEALPRDVAPGTEVYAGSLNLDGRLVIRVGKTGDQSALGRISALMQQAESSKPPIRRWLERHARNYLLLVLAVATLGMFITGGVEAFLAVLVAACPCALVLATPATAVAGVARAARSGILIKGGAFLEFLADVDALVIDKTGTLTSGRLQLQTLDILDGTPRDAVIRQAAALAACSSHPVSRAIARLHPGAAADLALTGVKEVRGKGTLAQSALGECRLGSLRWMQEAGIAADKPASQAASQVAFAVDGQLRAWFHLSDSARLEASEALADLRHLGIVRQTLLTGDTPAAAREVATELGIDTVVAQALPADKLHHVEAEVAAGHRPLVVGDGLNDSLALKAGAVGVAMGGHAADLTVAAADVVLTGNDLRALPLAIRLSRRARRLLAGNVVIGLGGIVVMVALVLSGVLGSLGLIGVAVLHNLTTLMVMINSARLLKAAP